MFAFPVNVFNFISFSTKADQVKTAKCLEQWKDIDFLIGWIVPCGVKGNVDDDVHVQWREGM